MSDKISLTGVIQIVCDHEFRSDVFDGCLFAAQLSTDGKVFCNEWSAAEWFRMDEDGNPELDTYKRIASYVITLVADLYDIPMREARRRWEKFCECVGDSFPRDERYVRSVRIESENDVYTGDGK